MNLYSFVCMAWLTSISCVKVNSMIWMGGYNVHIREPFGSYMVMCISPMSSFKFCDVFTSRGVAYAI